MAQSREQEKAMFAKLSTTQALKKYNTLSFPEKVQVVLLADPQTKRKEDFRPDLTATFPITQLNSQFRRRAFNILRQKMENKKVDRPNTVFGIRKQNDGSFNIAFLENGTVKEVKFKDLDSAKNFALEKAVKGFKVTQPQLRLE